MRTVYTSFGPPKASAFVYNFRRTWWPGAWWSRGLIKEKVLTAYRIDAREDTYEARERMVDLLHIITALHVMEHAQWLMSWAGSILINYMILTTVPMYLAQDIITWSHLATWMIRPLSLIIRIIMLLNFQVLTSGVLGLIPLYKQTWICSTQSLQALYQRDQHQLRQDLLILQPLDQHFPKLMIKRLVQRFIKSTNHLPTA